MSPTLRVTTKSAPAPGRTRAARPRRRSRWVLAGITVLALAVLGADRLAVHRAESRISDRISERAEERGTPLAKKPDVTIPAFPFLLRTADSIPEIRVEAQTTTADGLPVQAVIGLRDVAAKSGSYSAGKAEADLSTPLSAVENRLGPGTDVSADAGHLRITREVLGVPLTLTADLVLSGDTLTLRPIAATLAGRPIDPNGPRITEMLTAHRRRLPDLPMNLRPTAVLVHDRDITLHAKSDQPRLA